MRTAFIILCFVFSANAQQPNITKQACEDRATQIVKTLEPDNSLRRAVEQGDRGNCIRQSWMDKMQRFGIKQASFLIEYSWKNDAVSFKIKSTSYLRFYYFNYDTGAIKDKKVLREIRESGLEQELQEAILARVKTSAFAKREKNAVKRDIFEANLLDDEALPVLDIIF
jgi:hypothetical protein